MKKNDWKSGLVFGAIMAISNLIDQFYNLNDFSIFVILKIILLSALSGLLGGVIFVFLFSKFKRILKIAVSSKIDLLPDEKILLQDTANHIKGFESVGGRLFLTSQRLIFISHKMNIQNHTLSIERNDITLAEKCNVLKVFKNGLLVKLNNQIQEKFVVAFSDKWIEKLNR